MTRIVEWFRAILLYAHTVPLRQVKHCKMFHWNKNRIGENTNIYHFSGWFCFDSTSSPVTRFDWCGLREAADWSNDGEILELRMRITKKWRPP